MKRRPILVVTGLLLVAFGLGLWMGTRFCPEAVSYRAGPWPVQSARAPAGPAAGSPPPCVDIRNAGQLVGKNGCVTGLVLRVYSARTGNTFLDFCQDYRTCPFTSVIFASDKSKFGDLEFCRENAWRFEATWSAYQGHAEIIIRDPQQVRSAP